MSSNDPRNWMRAEAVKDIDLAEARQILDEDHYGFAKIKKRILEYLALTGQLRDVTKESAQAALTLVKEQAARLGLWFYEPANAND